MTWSRIDHAFRDHPKIDGLSHGAFRLHWNAILYSGQHLTDGLVEPTRPARLMPGFKKSYVDELVAAGLWDKHKAGWMIHDYLAFQQSAEDARARTEAKAAAGRAGGLKSAKVRQAKQQASASTKNEADASADASAEFEARHDTAHLNTSSSSPPLVPTGPADDDDEGPPWRSEWPAAVLQAAVLHSAAALASRTQVMGPVADRTAWLRTSKLRWLNENGVLAQRLLEAQPDRASADLVRLCGAVEQAPPKRPAREPHADCSDSGWIETQEGDVARCTCNPDLKLVTGGTP